MSSKSLSLRTADFLKEYPPFSFLPLSDLEQLAVHIRIRYFQEGDFIFRQGDPPGQQFYVLQKGNIELIEDQVLLDVCDVGDSFGMRSLISQNPYRLSARVVEEALVYIIPKPAFDELLSAHPNIAMFFAAGFASGRPVVRGTPREFDKARREMIFNKTSLQPGFREEDVLPVHPRSEVVFCFETNTIQEAAEIMAEYRVDSLVVVDRQMLPVGILTTMDFTRKIGTGRYAIEEVVTRVMSSPVITAGKDLTMAQAILTMMRHNIRHLIITEDGTPKTAISGMVNEHDILLSQGNHPGVMVKQMSKARTAEEMASIRNKASVLVQQYLQQEVSMPFITAILTEIQDVLIANAIKISLEKLRQSGLEDPGLAFCWLGLGSEGRGEQILRTDQDNALIYADPEPKKAEVAKEWFLALGREVVGILETCGYARCPGDIMASNPEWCQPIEGWKAHFSRWIRVPEPQALMHSTIFFDFRPLYGDARLAHQLADFLEEEIEAERSFLNFLAQNALGNPPPLSFLRNFIVERSGNHRNEFDVKLRGMMPLADAARLLIYHARQKGITNTVERFNRLSELEPEKKELYQEAVMAYELMMRFRAKMGFEQNNSGRYINPGQLNKIERQTLKYAFRAIEDLQSLIKSRFSLALFRT